LGKIRNTWINYKHLSKVQQPQSIFGQTTKASFKFGWNEKYFINWKHLVNSNWPNQLAKIAISLFQIWAKWKSFIRIWAT